LRHVTGRINGANTYQFVMGNPVGNVDPEGLATVMVDPVTGASFNWPSPPPASPPPGIYVYDTTNLHGLGFHQDIVVASPGGAQYAVSFGETSLFSGQGVVYPDNGESYWYTYEHLVLRTLVAGPFGAVAQAYLQSLLGKMGPYNVFTNNCRVFSQSQFNKIENMYNQFLKNNANTIQNVMNEQNNMIPGWSGGGAVFTS
jgi:hypothetical protein